MSKSVLVRNKTLTLTEAVADPTEVGSIVLWLDGQDPLANGNPPASGTAVPTWFDKSPNGFNFTSLGTGGAVGQYVASGFNGLPAVQISVTQNGYAAPASLVTPSGSYTIFAVVDQNAGAANFDGAYLLDKSNAGRLVLNTAVVPNGSDFLYFQTAFQLPGNGLNGEKVQVWRFDDIAGTAEIRRDFSDLVSDTAYVSTTLDGDLVIGERFTGGGVTNYQGHIAELFIYDEALTPQQISAIEGYLQGKWGL